ncbi:unnamed protein product [Cuscuta campestris]|uniref:Uncharacterized protein n=1 Tax=Cuscuta campestris TaxID=132261 RepID=A0A484KJK2_9ASTE|nr:unnamed protein product [Cuscuta campestris]
MGIKKKAVSATSSINGLDGGLAISIGIGHEDRRIGDGLLLRRWVVLRLQQQRRTIARGGKAEPNLRRTLVFVGQSLTRADSGKPIIYQVVKEMIEKMGYKVMNELLILALL